MRIIAWMDFLSVSGIQKLVQLRMIPGSCAKSTRVRQFQSDMFFCSGTLRKHGSHILYILLNEEPIPNIYFERRNESLGGHVIAPCERMCTGVKGSPIKQPLRSTFSSI